MIVPQLDFIDAVDLVSILGNLWENAIDGCMHAHEERFDIPSITFRTFVNSNHFVLELSNSCVSNLGSSLSLPKNEPGHGIGTSVIRKLVDKYHGIYGYKVINNVYISRVAIPISSESYDKLDACIVFNWKTTNNDVSTHKYQE